MDPKWRPVEDVELKDLSIDDDDIEPFVIKCDRFEYKNKAQIKLDEEIEAAMAEYDKRHRNLSPFDAIAPPAIAGLAGGIRPIDITKNAHFSLTSPNLLSTTRIIRIRIRWNVFHYPFKAKAKAKAIDATTNPETNFPGPSLEQEVCT